MSNQSELLADVQNCANLFRLGKSFQAVDPMADCFASLYQILNAQALPVAEFGTVVTRALACQERQDFAGLADELEYVLLPLLHRFWPQS